MKRLAQQWRDGETAECIVLNTLKSSFLPQGTGSERSIVSPPSLPIWYVSKVKIRHFVPLHRLTWFVFNKEYFSLSKLHFNIPCFRYISFLYCKILNCLFFFVISVEVSIIIILMIMIFDIFNIQNINQLRMPHNSVSCLKNIRISVYLLTPLYTSQKIWETEIKCLSLSCRPFTTYTSRPMVSVKPLITTPVPMQPKGAVHYNRHLTNNK